MILRHLNRIFHRPVRFLSTSGRPETLNRNENLSFLNNKLLTPKYFDYLKIFLKEQGYEKFISKKLLYNYEQTIREYQELYEILSDTNKSDNDKDFTSLASDEAAEYLKNIEVLQNEILSEAIHDDRDVDKCTFEIRSGVGGKEATLFAGELTKAYLKLFDYNQWVTRFDKNVFEQIDLNDSSSLASYTFEVYGNHSYSLLRHEAGIHRVQRVPKTERYGRIHTSTASVFVIPIRKNLIEINQSDLKFEATTSSGPGGQHVNRTYSCIRCIHIPTGLATESQESRDQQTNKKIAIEKLEAILNRMEYERLEREARSQHRIQVGIAARSDKIRTYNFPQDRITDHRLGSSDVLHDIKSYFAGEQSENICRRLKVLEDIRHKELVQQMRSAIEQVYRQKFK